MAYKTNLGGSDASFASMMGRFGIVTVMNAKVFPALSKEEYAGKTAYEIYQDAQANANKALCELDTLKIANVTVDGPNKTVTGGRYSNALIKFGKSARLEMQDALGNAAAIEYLCGGVQEWDDGVLTGLHVSEDFAGPKMIVGDTFFIDQKSGKQVKVGIVFYQFLPDSIFNLTQDAEGDATVFDMNGDLLTTEILMGREEGDPTPHGVFYSIVNPDEVSADAKIFTLKKEENGSITITKGTDATEYTYELDGQPMSSNTGTVAKGTAAIFVVKKGTTTIIDRVIRA